MNQKNTDRQPECEATGSQAFSEFLTFKLDQELFAIEIAKVQAILEVTHVTRVPRVPNYLRGVTNLRGQVLPVVDLRLKLGLSRTEDTVDTCVIVSEVAVDGEQTLLGLLADAVQEVVYLNPSMIHLSPKLGLHVDQDIMHGIAHHQNQSILLLDLEKVFQSAQADPTDDAPDRTDSAAPTAVPASQ